MLTTSICKFSDFNTDWYKRFAEQMRLDNCALDYERRNLHRKTWEFAVISQVLFERDMLRPGRSGIGFAVGKEPLPSLFASCGVSVLATDLSTESSDQNWIETGQHSTSREDLFRSFLIARPEFDRLVRFQSADMRGFPEIETGQSDFVWSSCALEHLGSLEAGWDFVERSVDLLKPGGIAVHTTEYNVSSNDQTQEDGDAVIYRRKDIEALDGRLRRKSCCMVSPDFNAGDSKFDLLYDFHPYYKNDRKHIKLRQRGHICTSAVLIVLKA